MRKSRKLAVRQESGTLLSEFILILKGAVIAVAITLGCIILFAFIMQLGGLKESIIRPVVQVIRILSIALGGAYVARLSLSKGWMKGAATGFLYVLLASLVGVFYGGQFALDGIFLSDVLMALAVGAIGGAIGINLR